MFTRQQTIETLQQMFLHLDHNTDSKCRQNYLLWCDMYLITIQTVSRIICCGVICTNFYSSYYTFTPTLVLYIWDIHLSRHMFGNQFSFLPFLVIQLHVYGRLAWERRYMYPDKWGFTIPTSHYNKIVTKAKNFRIQVWFYKIGIFIFEPTSVYEVLYRWLLFDNKHVKLVIISGL